MCASRSTRFVRLAGLAVSARIRSALRAVAVAVLGLMPLGCSNDGAGGGGGGGTGPEDPTLLITQGTSAVVALTGTSVNVTAELTGGDAIANQTIHWAVTGGGGSVPATSQTTNTGVSTVPWTLGPLVGIQTLKAEFIPDGGAAVSDEAKATGVTNPACVPGDMLAETSLNWTPAKGAIVLPEGAEVFGDLTIAPGVTICIGPSLSISTATAGRIVAQGTAQAPILVTAMDIAQPWGYLTFQGTPGSPSTLDHVNAYYGTGGFFGSGNQHPVIITNSLASGMAIEGLALTAPGSAFVNSVVDGVQAGPGAELGSIAGGPITFSGRITGAATSGAVVVGPGVVMSNCELRGNTETGVTVAHNGLPFSVNGCNIFGNGSREISSLDFSGAVDATGNWWGSPSGPDATEIAGNVDVSAPLGSAVNLGY